MNEPQTLHRRHRVSRIWDSIYERFWMNQSCSRRTRGTHRLGHLAPLSAAPLLLRKQKEIVVRLPAPLWATRAWEKTQKAAFSTRTFISRLGCVSFKLKIKKKTSNKCSCHEDQRTPSTLLGCVWVCVYLPFLNKHITQIIRSPDSSLVLLTTSSSWILLNVVLIVQALLHVCCACDEKNSPRGDLFPGRVSQVCSCSCVPVTSAHSAGCFWWHNSKRGTKRNRLAKRKKPKNNFKKSRNDVWDFHFYLLL